MVPGGFSAFLFTSPETTIVGNRIGGVNADLKPGHIYYGGLGVKPAEMIFNSKVDLIVCYDFNKAIPNSEFLSVKAEYFSAFLQFFQLP